MKKKYSKIIVMIVISLFVSITPCFAIEFTVDELGEEIDRINPNATTAFIIGEYVFTSEHLLTTQDVMLAARTISVSENAGSIDKDAIYGEMTIQRLEAQYDDNYDKTGWISTDNVIGTTQLPEKINISYIDYEETKEIVKYTVTFDNDGTLSTSSVKEGLVVSKPEDPVKDGYKFIGWYNGNEEYDFTKPVTEDITLTAKYVSVLDIDTLLQTSVNKVNNEYYTASYADKIITYNIINNDIKSAALQNTGLIGGIRDLLKADGIKELTIKSGDKTYIFDEPNENLEVGQSSAVFLTMIQMLEETTGMTISDITLDDLIGAELDVTISLEDGYISKAGNNLEQYKALITGEKTPVYTVTFDVDGTQTYSQVKSGKTVIEPTAPTKEGYTFDGWYTDSELTTKYEFTNIVNSNIVLYAKFNINNYNVKFYDGDTELTDLAQIVEYGKTINNVTPTKEGYAFVGWYTDSTLTTEYSSSLEIKNDVVLYAKWKQVVANITTQAELEAALANADITTINLINNISVDKSIIIDRSIAINGNNNTMSLTTVTSGNNQVLKTYSGDEEISVELKDIKLTGANAALIVLDNSKVIATNVDVSGNAWGGIEVKNVATSSLIATGITNTSEEEGHATIWVDETNIDEMLATILCEEVAVQETEGSNGKPQVQYYLSQTGNLNDSSENDNIYNVAQSVTIVTSNIGSGIEDIVLGE